MTQSTAPQGRTRRGRSHSWLPALTLVMLTALAAPYAGSAAGSPQLGLAATNLVGGQVEASQWTQRPPLQSPRFAHDVATVDGSILVVGGATSFEELLETVEARQVSGDGAWHTLAPLPTARGNPAAAELDGKVYVAGGFDLHTTLSVVEVFDPRTGAWTTTAKLPVPRGAAAAAGLGGLLYVAGGFLGGRNIRGTASVLAYDPTTDSWTSVAPMPTARGRLRLIAAGGQLYAIGGVAIDDGSSALSTVERYDPRTNTWTTLASMTQDRALPGVVAIEHGSRLLIVVVAGFKSVDSTRIRLASTEVYDIESGRWHLLQAQLPHPTASLVAAAESDGTVLAIGGNVLINEVPTTTAQVYALKITDHDS